MISRLESHFAALAALIPGATVPRLEAQEGPAPATAPRQPSVPPLPPLRAAERPTEPPAPRVIVRQGPTFAALEDVADLDALPRGPRRLLELLHETATSTARARGYRVTPSQVTIHQPQELLAAALGCHVVTVWRWTTVLKAAGYVDARAHFTSSKGSTRADGTLYAVSLQAGHRAHLTHDDLSFQWRDLDADRAAGNTAWAALQGSDQKQEAGWKILLRNWAVTPGSVTHDPLVPDHCNGPRTVLDVVYTLPLIADAHRDKRAALVGILGAALARALNDQHSRKWWCRVIWSAWKDETEGRAGLQVLGAMLTRLEADRAEWEGLRNPGALMAGRLRASA